MANTTIGNLPVATTPLIGADIVPLSRDGINLNKTTMNDIKVFTNNLAFGHVLVSGQTTVDSTVISDSLTLVAGTNVAITTNNASKSLTISSTAAGLSFLNVAVSGQSTVVAATSTDTLTLVAGSGVSITTNASTKAVTINSTVTGSGASIPSYSLDVTAGRIIATTDLQNLLVYNSATNATFTIPTDTTLALSGYTNSSFEIFQKGTGVASVVGATGVIINSWVGYPTPTQYVTQTIHRVGANTWAVK